MKNEKIVSPEYLERESFKEYFNKISIPIGSKIIIESNGSGSVPKEIEGKYGKITRFLDSKNVSVEIEYHGVYNVPLGNIELAPGQRINLLKRCHYFFINKRKVKNRSSKKNFKILSLPIGSIVKLNRSSYNAIPEGLDDKSGKIVEFLNSEYVSVEIKEYGVFNVPPGNIELAPGQKVSFFKRIYHFFINRSRSIYIE